MTERDKQRLDELELKTAYIQARQDEQDTRMNRLMARLIYLEARQYRILKELGLNPETIDSPEAAQTDAKTINLSAIPHQRMN